MAQEEERKANRRQRGNQGRRVREFVSVGYGFSCSRRLSPLRSGLKLVPSPKRPKRRLATEKQMAKMDFNPWNKDERGLSIFGGESWHKHGINVRFAYSLMLMSKKEMIGLHRDVDQDHIDVLFANIFETAEFLNYVAGMMESA